MNEGDVYILDVGEILYVWNGQSSSRSERIKVCLYIIINWDDIYTPYTMSQ